MDLIFYVFPFFLVPPLLPSGIRVDTTTMTATVVFTVEFTIHGSEQYFIRFGSSLNTLDQQSETILSASNGSIEQMYNIQVGGFSPGVTYYFQIVASNDISNTSTGIFSATTQETGNNYVMNYTINFENVYTELYIYIYLYIYKLYFVCIQHQLQHHKTLLYLWKALH